MISVQNLSKKYGNLCVLKNIDVEFKKGSIVGLVGLSGSGKSTFLRCLHGLEIFEQGHIKNEGITGLIFQHFNLFPHMNVLENIIYAPINVMKVSKKAALAKATALLERMHLLDKKNAYPHQLSGGQKQRVAILRALIMSPEILLLDEPTSALDPSLTHEMIQVIHELKKEKLTIIVASHDLAFLKQSVDRIVYLENGKLMSDQSAKEFFNGQNKENHALFNPFNQPPIIDNFISIQE